MWYVIQTTKGREKKVMPEIRQHVAEPDEPVFVMEYEKMYRHHGEWTPDRVNLFAGYIFVDTKRPEAFDIRLRSKYHPLKLMTVDDVITPIRPEEQSFLMELGGEEHIVRYSEGFKENDRIIIESGPLKGHEGEIEKIDRHNREGVIRLKMFGRELMVTLGLGIVKVI